MADGDTLTQGQPEIEAKAREQGWRPKEEFRGDPEKWRPADEFLRRGEEILPILRDQHKRTEEMLSRERQAREDDRRQLNEMAQTLKEFREFSAKGEERAYERAKRELEQKLETSVMHADVETFRQTKEELDKLEKPKPVEARKPAGEGTEVTGASPTLPAEVMTWVNENPWFNKDFDMTETAKQQDAHLMKMHPHWTHAERLAEVLNRVKRVYPEKFQNDRRSEPAPVGDGGGGTPPSKANGKKTFSDLPAQARAAYERFAKQMPNYTKDEYLKVYFAGENE